MTKNIYQVSTKIGTLKKNHVLLRSVKIFIRYFHIRFPIWMEFCVTLVEHL